ncbi:uncharacterized protein LOC144704531 [Wolffia australiana]
MASAAGVSMLCSRHVAPRAAAPPGLAALRPVRISGGAARRARPAAAAKAAMGEKAAAGLTAAAVAAVAAAFIVPEIAEAAQPGVSSSLKNFLLSIASGGLVLGVILGAVIAVSNFDPVKRN